MRTMKKVYVVIGQVNNAGCITSYIERIFKSEAEANNYRQLLEETYGDEFTYFDVEEHALIEAV